MYSWKQASDPGVCDAVHEMSVNGRKLGELHFYEGVGYFAYFMESQLNRSPLRSLKMAMNLVHDAHTEWPKRRRRLA